MLPNPQKKIRWSYWVASTLAPHMLRRPLFWIMPKVNTTFGGMEVNNSCLHSNVGLTNSWRFGQNFPGCTTSDTNMTINNIPNLFPPLFLACKVPSWCSAKYIRSILTLSYSWLTCINKKMFIFINARAPNPLPPSFAASILIQHSALLLIAKPSVTKLIKGMIYQCIFSRWGLEGDENMDTLAKKEAT